MLVGGEGTAALSPHCYGLQAADSAGVSDDTSKHVHNWYSRNTVKQLWLRPPKMSSLQALCIHNGSDSEQKHK